MRMALKSKQNIFDLINLQKVAAIVSSLSCTMQNMFLYLSIILQFEIYVYFNKV